MRNARAPPAPHHHHHTHMRAHTQRLSPEKRVVRNGAEGRRVEHMEKQLCFSSSTDGDSVQLCARVAVGTEGGLVKWEQECEEGTREMAL